MKKLKLLLFTTLLFACCDLALVGCKQNNRMAKLDALVEKENAQCPMQSGDYILKKVSLDAENLIFHYFLTEEQMKNINPGLTKEKILENSQDNATLKQLATLLLNEHRGLQYLYTDSTSTISIKLSASELENIQNGNE